MQQLDRNPDPVLVWINVWCAFNTNRVRRGVNFAKLEHRGERTVDIDSQEWRYVLAGSADGSIYIHDLANFCGIPRHNSNLIATIKGDGAVRDAVTSYQLMSRDIGSREMWIPLHNRRRGATSGLHSEKSHGHSNSVTTVQWYPEDSGIFVTSGMDGTVKMWDANVLEKGPVEEFDLPYENFAKE